MEIYKKVTSFLCNNIIITTIISLLTLNQQCFANKIMKFGLEPFIMLGSNNIIKEHYGIKVYTNILDYISIDYNIIQNVINNDYYIENIANNIIAHNKQEIILPGKFYHYCYDISLKARTPEIFRSRLIVAYDKHNNFNRDNYELLYISQDIAFFSYETYRMNYEINFKEFLLDLYLKQNYIYDNIKDNFEYGIDYVYRFNSNSSLTLGYSYSYDKLKDNFDDGIAIPYFTKDKEYLYFKYNKRIVAQINKNLLIRKNINSVKMASNFKINDNMRAIFSLVISIDNNKNKSLFFKFGLGF